MMICRWQARLRGYGKTRRDVAGPKLARARDELQWLDWGGPNRERAIPVSAQAIAAPQSPSKLATASHADPFASPHRPDSLANLTRAVSHALFASLLLWIPLNASPRAQPAELGIGEADLGAVVMAPP